MYEKRTCLECGKTFKVSRKPENFAAFIRFCDACKKRFKYIEQAESSTMRTVTERPGGRGRKAYLSVN